MTAHEMLDRENPRSSVEERIALQAECLRALANLIQNKVPFRSWPRRELSVLMGALQSDGRNDFEDRKARNLQRHLFRGDAHLIDVPRLPQVHDLEERVRADLPGLVRLGAGRGL